MAFRDADDGEDIVERHDAVGDHDGGDGAPDVGLGLDLAGLVIVEDETHGNPE